ncbi:hypothetical protein [Haladaptatus sp. DYSN1]|uniref:DUF7308 domain-containing protein n=1 Tax=unclassified Haladaptatus TaxID=2622732 RepID=UPI002404DC12|nr:hypothetical protein [Haladaptatus sp. DYSN1]
MTLDHETQTTTLDLIVPFDMGYFNMPANKPLRPRALGPDHPLDEFNITQYPDQTGFSNFKWSFVGIADEREIEIHLRESGNVRKVGSCWEKDISVTITYENGSSFEGWHAEDAFQTTCYDSNGDGTKDSPRVDVDLGSMTKQMVYIDTKSRSLSIANLVDGTHQPASQAYNGGADTAIGDVLSHYLGEMGPASTSTTRARTRSKRSSPTGPSTTTSAATRCTTSTSQRTRFTSK